MKKAPPIVLSDNEREILDRWSRGRSTPARTVLRAGIVLRAAEGKQNKQIAAEMGINPNTVVRWRSRFAEFRLAGIEKDAPRGGRIARRRRHWARKIIEATTQTKPTNATHWTTRTLAVHLGCDRNMVRRVWKANGLQPHRSRSFKVSNDRQFADKVVDVVGLYLDPPQHALVLCVDEKSQIQALDRTQPGLPLKPGHCGTMTHDYQRHGTTTLFAAIDMTEGKLIGSSMPRHRHQEWIKFLTQIDQQTPARLDLHLVADNYATHKHAKVLSWLKRHPRFHMHFTPTSSSWLNLIERWFRDLTEKMIRRGTFLSVDDLIDAITAYIENHNKDPRPFAWTAKAERILEKVRHARAVLDKMPSA
jgi:DNA-binding CsgD family transcriptional regulator/transposase